jgi:shikimate kinase
MRNRILLVGPMGAGKTTIGTLVSAELGWKYIDNDAEMAEISGLSEAELSQLSVPELHGLEESYLMNIASRPGPFIAGAAASVVENIENLKVMQELSTIYLYIPLELQLERAGGVGIGRQALQENPDEVIRERFIRRDPRYRQAADLTLELSDSPEADAAKLVSFIRSS